MSDKDLQSATKESCLQDCSKYETQTMLEMLGKFKSSEAIVQAKHRPYRLHSDGKDFLDRESNRPSGENKDAKDDCNKKSSFKASSSSKQIPNSDVKFDRGRTERISSKPSVSKSSVDRCSSDKRSSSVSKDGCHKNSSSASYGNQESNKSWKSNKNDNKHAKDYSISNEKPLRHSDDSDGVRRDGEKSELDEKKRSNADLTRFEREQAELEKRIQELKKEISREKSKIKEIESRVDNAKMLNSSEVNHSSSIKVKNVESSQTSEKSAVSKSGCDSTSHLQRSAKPPQRQSSDSKGTSHSRQYGREHSRARRSRSRSLKTESHKQDIKCRFPVDADKFDSKKSQAQDMCRDTNLRNRDDFRSSNYRDSGYENERRRNSGSSRRRSRSQSVEKRHSETKYTDKCKQNTNRLSSRREEIADKQHLCSHDSLPSLVKTKNSNHNRQDDQDLGKEDNRNKLNEYLRNYHSQASTAEKMHLSSSQSHSTCDSNQKKASDGNDSPASVYSFDLDWPRSPHQPGVNLRAKDGRISPLSQLLASNDTRFFQEESRAEIIRSKITATSRGRSILGQQLLAQRYSQQNSVSDIWAVRSIDCFELMQKIGRGSYGQIFKAADKDKNLVVAVKKVMADDKDGFPASALRELKYLSILKHPNIIRLLEVAREVHGKGSSEILGAYYYVYEYVSHDLKGIIESDLVRLSSNNIACLMMQLLSALEYCHSRDLIHGNIKSSNILINYRGQMKLTDFGMSTSLKDASERKCLQLGIGAQLWYQAPELLLGSEKCEASIDMWSSGCILGEMFHLKPLFPGEDDLHQLCMISALCGSPDAVVWPGVTQLPRYYVIKSRERHPRQLREKFSFLPSAALDLLDALLVINPQRRCTAAKALQMDWLRDIDIHRMAPIILPKTTDCHSTLNESKSGLTSEATSQRVKRNFNPDLSHSAKEFEDEMEVKRRKMIGKFCSFLLASFKNEPAEHVAELLKPLLSV